MRENAMCLNLNLTRNRQYGRIAPTNYLKKYLGKPEIHKVSQ